LAGAIQTGEVDEVLAMLHDGVEPDDPDEGQVGLATTAEVEDLLADRLGGLRAAAAAGDHRGALEAFAAHRLLCAHRDGAYGVSTWNHRAERMLLTASGETWMPEWYAGRPFIVDRNDRGLHLWNGDTGVACTSSDGRLVAVVDDGRSATGRVLPTGRLADVTTAHAMTVHRSQGSQFDEVTVLLPESGSLVLTRELFYTAVTRARRRVRVVGSDAAIRAAVTRRAQRATGLADRLG
jgi:exodeoxyribonuclease V alpha subunit